MPTRFERKVYTGKGLTTLSYIAEEGFSGIVNLNNPDNSEDTCFINVRAHETKPGHKVSWPTRTEEEAVNSRMVARHIGDFNTSPVEFINRRDHRLKFSARWIKANTPTSPSSS